MDIAKYIGLFLLKNNFCYVHGLGNLELKKRSATHDGEALQPPTYEVIVSPAGSIDDNLANFIATNEQVSISKASNALRDFSTKAREELAEGKEVLIPALGKFTETHGKIQFITDPHFQYTPPRIPSIKSATRSTVIPKATPAQSVKGETAYSYNPADDKDSHASINWGKIILVLVLAAIVIAGIIFGINYMQPTPVAPAEPEMTAEPVQNAAADDEYSTDLATENTAQEPPTSPAGTTTQSGPLRFIINTYADSGRAAKRVGQLSSYGHTVSMMPAPNGHWQVIMPYSAPLTDTAHVMDSLSRTFNPNGVRILR